MPDPYVSKAHAAIAAVGGALMVEDLGSKNGTFVDTTRIERAWLVAGAQLRIGRQLLRVTPQLPSGGREQARSTSPMIGSSSAMLELARQLERFATLRLPVLLRGETGTGKELAARLVHDLGPRRSKPFVAVNCGAISPSLAESQLFGHARGAFTGADRRHDGYFVEASGGTLFLDELGELPLELQAKLLRTLETRSVRPVGAERDVSVDVRVVGATHRPLERMIAEGRFREDLYHRLSVLVVDLPPLRERTEDIPVLLEYFGSVAEHEVGRSVAFTPSAISAARAHPWPGNVRALRHAVLRAAALADGPIGPGLLLPKAPRHVSTIEIPRGDFESMKRALLERIVVEHGSIRTAAAAIGVPRSTLGAWLKR